MSDGTLYGRSAGDDAFYEWLLSDHPAAKAERERRRSACYQRQRDTAAGIAAWADRISAGSPRPAQAVRDLAATMGPRAAASATGAEVESAEPDDLYVARLREQLETHRHVDWDHPDPAYRYPGWLTGPSAASYPPPPDPHAGIEPGT
jgi:hypothetical protein